MITAEPDVAEGRWVVRRRRRGSQAGRTAGTGAVMLVDARCRSAVGARTSSLDMLFGWSGLLHLDRVQVSQVQSRLANNDLVRRVRAYVLTRKGSHGGGRMEAGWRQGRPLVAAQSAGLKRARVSHNCPGWRHTPGSDWQGRGTHVGAGSVGTHSAAAVGGITKAGLATRPGEEHPIPSHPIPSPPMSEYTYTLAGGNAVIVFLSIRELRFVVCFT